MILDMLIQSLIICLAVSASDNITIVYDIEAGKWEEGPAMPDNAWPLDGVCLVALTMTQFVMVGGTIDGTALPENTFRCVKPAMEWLSPTH